MSDIQDILDAIVLLPAHEVAFELQHYYADYAQNLRKCLEIADQDAYYNN